MEEQRSQGAVDERFQAFIETEANKQQLQVSLQVAIGIYVVFDCVKIFSNQFIR